MKLTKLKSIIMGFAFLAASTFFLVFFAINALTANSQNEPTKFSIFGLYTAQQTITSANQNLSTIFFAFLFIIMMLDISLYLIGRAYTLNDKNITAYQNKSFWRILATYYLIKESAAAAIIFVVYLLFTLCSLSALISIPFLNEVKIGFDFWALIGALILYWPLKTALLKIFSKINEWTKKFKPVYKITPTGVDIDSKIMGLTEDKRTFHVEFSELDEIRLMNYFEAQSYMEALGPNLDEWRKQVGGSINLGKERPKTYLIPQGGTNILFKGSDIHYLLAFNQDGKDLLEAFNKK